jgi:hypothetical protein
MYGKLLRYAITKYHIDGKLFDKMAYCLVVGNGRRAQVADRP